MKKEKESFDAQFVEFDREDVWNTYRITFKCSSSDLALTIGTIQDVGEVVKKEILSVISNKD